jgi:hypothetical protein
MRTIDQLCVHQFMVDRQSALHSMDMNRKYTQWLFHYQISTLRKTKSQI